MIELERNKVCSVCNKEFLSVRQNVKHRFSTTCSSECRQISRTSNKEVKNLCMQCGKEFLTKRSRKETAKFCSIECYTIGRSNLRIKESIELSCINCNKAFRAYQSSFKRKYCCRECFIEYRNKRKNTNKINRQKRLEVVKKERGCNFSREYRKIIFEHKSKKCELCGYDDFSFNLDVHHIDNNPDNNEINNLAVLCAHCHRMVTKGLLHYPLCPAKIEDMKELEREFEFA